MDCKEDDLFLCTQQRMSQTRPISALSVFSPSDFFCDKRLALEKIRYGEKLLEIVSQYDVDGILKLHRKIKQELNFLEKVYEIDGVKKEHLQCTNLTHFSALLNTLKDVNNCISVNKPFNLRDRKVIVDIVCDGGLSWIKVVARNPKSLSQISMGDTNYGVRSIIDQAKEYLECASLYPTLFQTPKITFVFSNGIGKQLAQKIESLGVYVDGERLDLGEEIDGYVWQGSELSVKNNSNIAKINLDVSAMLAYVSSVTNGSCDKYEFSVPVLAQQASWESKRPVKPLLDNFFEGKKLYCCKTAKDSFLSILDTVGGPSERIRSREFLERVTVLPDDATVADTVHDYNNSAVFDNVQYSGDNVLEVGGKIRERSLRIFSFGDRIQAVTVTSNDGFVRAAKQKGINFVVFVHESRALTEQKETKAKLIS